MCPSHSDKLELVVAAKVVYLQFCRRTWIPNDSFELCRPVPIESLSFYTIYIYIYILAGYPASLETLSPGLSPPPSLVPLSPLSYPSLPSTLPPSDYPASLRITAFPRYFLNTCFGYFFGRIFLFIDFLGSS